MIIGVMLFYKYICDYVLENITVSKLIDAALDCVLDGMKSENLCILAGLNKNENPFVILEYYDKTIDELKIKLPNNKEAANYLVSFYCNELLSEKISPKLFLEKIKEEIYDKLFDFYKDNKYMGEDIGIKSFVEIYYWVYEIETNEYYDNLNKNELLTAEYKNCYEKAKEHLKKNI